MRKVLNIIIFILDLLLIALYGVLKIDYYINVKKVGMDGLSIYDIIWIPVSLLITFSPLLVQMGLILFLKVRKQLAAFIIPSMFLVGNMFFEFFSWMGSAMCLDDRWTEMAEIMMASLLLFGVPLILALIGMIAEIRAGKKK